jgi:hypothetical protein
MARPDASRDAFNLESAVGVSFFTAKAQSTLKGIKPQRVAKLGLC